MPNEERHHELLALATLFKTLNGTLAQISAVLGRPAQVGHAGEFIASAIFDIDLHRNAAFKDHDGYFNARSPLVGRSVNVKWGLLQEGGMDLSASAVVDDLLVMTGPRASTARHASRQRPWVIASVHLFDVREIVGTLQAGGLGIGVASSVRKRLWEAAMIYPAANNPRLIVTPEQRSLLDLFASPLADPATGPT